MALALAASPFRPLSPGCPKLDGRDLAKATGLHRNTITNIEVGRYAGDPKSLELIEAVLRKSGVEFIDENGGGAGVRLRKAHQQGRRR